MKAIGSIVKGAVGFLQITEMAERHDARAALNVARGLVDKVQELIKNQ